MTKNTQKANVAQLRETTRNVDSYRKENAFHTEIAAIDPATGRAIVTARLYLTNSTARACVWISGKYTESRSNYGRGFGKAGGYGYHRPSAALADAIDDAGIALAEPISGRGDYAMKEAVEAIARAVTGKRKFILHTAHA